MIGVVRSRADEASEHIVSQLLDLTEWTEHVDETRSDAEGGGTYYRTEGIELRSFDDLHLELERPADAFADIDWLAFASRHSGDTGPLLTAHVTGNFGRAQFGGRDRELAEAAPAALDRIVEGLAEHAPEGYDVGIECTHHGPSEVGVPSLFVEVGSGPDQWDDPEGARAVAQAILDASKAPAHHPREAPGSPRRQLVGIGGGHYAPRFTRILRETDWSVGHIAADWCLEDLGEPGEHRGVLDSAFERSAAEYAVLEGNYPGVETVIDDLGYEVVSETWVRETDGVPIEFVERVEDALGRVADGIRFGEQAGEGVETIEIDTLPKQLIERARPIDAEETRDSVEAHTVAFETEQRGTRLGQQAAYADEHARGALVDALIAVLERQYDVDRDDGAIVLTEKVFDPERARTLGVPEGPAFGTLSNGQSVTVDGREIDPDAVTVEQQHVIDP
jgi:D-aminoacyl-tRNA deacylase